MHLVLNSDSVWAGNVRERLVPVRRHAYAAAKTLMNNLPRDCGVGRELDGRACWYRSGRSELEAAIDAYRRLVAGPGSSFSALPHVAHTAAAADSGASRQDSNERQVCG